MAIRLTLYRVGALTHWPVIGRPVRHDSQRGRIADLSKKSRLRCAFAFGNAQKDWGAMATLTFRTQPREPKRALNIFSRAMRNEVGEIQWAWVMEWQERGVIHFHLFFEREWIERVGYFTETVVRHGHETELLRGPIDEWIQAIWCKAVGDRHPDFRRFQAGGIVELLRTPDAAARYVAKEAGKRAQKQLPAGVEAAGRWWWLHPAFKPKPCGTLTIERWPYPKAYHHVFDVEQLKRQTFREVPLVVTLAARRTIITRPRTREPVRTSDPDRRASDNESHPCHLPHSSPLLVYQAGRMTASLSNSCVLALVAEPSTECS